MGEQTKSNPLLGIKMRYHAAKKHKHFFNCKGKFSVPWN